MLTTARQPPDALHVLAEVARVDAAGAIERALSAARELLGMELAYVTEADAATFRFHALDGAAEPFGGPVAGAATPRADTFCDRMLTSARPVVIPDTAAVPPAAGSPGVRAYVGVPVQLTDGTMFGTLCCVAARPQPLGERDARLLEVLARIIGDQIQRERDRRRTARLEGEAAAGQALLAALKARERYTARHSEAVVDLATAVAQELGLGDGEIIEVAQVALLHDIGKLGVPDAILQKPGALDEAEWRIMRAHPAMGERVVASLPSLAHLAPAVRAEHERWDGAGYPDGLAGEAIPLASRICLACDAWHAMTSDRPYRPALPEGEARAELIRHAGAQFCPRTVDALLSVLDGSPAPPPPAPERASGQPESELRALIAVAGAVSAAHRLEDVLEVVAEETRRVVGAGSVSISRWERDVDLLRTLINVDVHGRWERFPVDETYVLADYPLAARLLTTGESYVISRGDPSLSPADRALLDEFELASYIGVPVIFDGRVWGKLETFADLGEEPFTRRHVPFLETIAGQVGAAIGRAELFSRVTAFAYADALTGLGNRRALDERLDAAIARGGRVTIAFCDLDGLKAINDTQGHDAGDAAIRRAADALSEAARDRADAFVCRVGGDEFCLVLEGCGPEEARTLVAGAIASLGELTLSCGVAELQPGQARSDLFRAADAAQYAAKRGDPGLIAIADRQTVTEAGSGRRTRRDHPSGELNVIAARVLAAALAEAPEHERLERIARLLAG